MNYTEMSRLLIETSVKAGKEILKVYDTAFEIEIKSDNSPLTKADLASNTIITEALLQTGIPVISEESKSIDYSKRLTWNQYWLVDPLDGTKEFISRNGEFTVNIALIKNRKPVMGVVYAPVTGDLYFGIVGEGAYKIKCLSHKNIDYALTSKQHLPISVISSELRVVASRSHMNAETEHFVEQLKVKHKNISLLSKGSSLKLCLIAEGSADIYPRFGPTMEWDIAAGHAIVEASRGKLYRADDGSDFLYNKENLLNPYFIAESAGFNPKS